MHSNRPYLLKAFFDWIVDNQCTPYVIVDANYIGVEVPQEFVNDARQNFNALVGLRNGRVRGGG